MALLQFKAPVDYEKHQGMVIFNRSGELSLTSSSEAFEGFLQTFKTSPTSALASALDGMNIDEDDFSDEYDFMDDDEEEGQNARRRTKMQAKEPKLKYSDLLQKVADRYEDEITIDLDDLAKVRRTASTLHQQTADSM
jgi:DNA replication licensing factor MCM7